MANRPFEYRIINPLERPKSEDLNIAQGQSHYDVRQLAYEMFARNNGFLGYSFNPEPNAPTANNSVWLQQGVAFQFGAAESDIGGINGLNDTYRHKAVNISNKNIPVTDPPVTASHRRYDLIQIRALQETERLEDPESTDIFDATLKTFSSLTKDKTLTSSLTPQTPVYTAAGDAVTAPLSYVTGISGVYAGWSAVPKPAVATGYLGVAYIRRYEGQTAITAADIEDARTLLVVPAMAGGTGNTAAAFTGSVAWFDTAEGKIKYTQAQLGAPTFAPVSGYVLSSNASGEPTWIAPGSAGQVLMSDGTAWVSADAGGSVSYLSSTTAPISETCNFVEITCIGAGGGGGGGARSDILGENGSGGAGGGGGGLTRVLYSGAALRALGTDFTITVGTGGAGGGGAAFVNTNGVNGSNGGDSAVLIGATQIARATGGKGGTGGAQDGGLTRAGGAGGVGTTESGTSGADATPSGSVEDSADSSIGAPTGGGAGGGWNGGPAAEGGGSSGSSGVLTRNLVGSNGGASDDPGVAGTAGQLSFGGTGGGGGGGSNNVADAAGAGGAGGAAGGGGGGGGYCRITTAIAGSGGAGGAGGNGRVIIRQW